MSNFCGNVSKMRQGQWSDLPSDLISDIADRLDLLEVVRFRCVCQSWNFASSTASAKIESTENYEPWFLHYGYGDDERTDPDLCQLVTTENGIISMSLPQLDASCTCIASYEGWLLVFKQGGSMFFFRPFSKTKIDLPQFPVSELSDHVAAFSSPPTCSDCRVCVISRSASNDNDLQVKILCRGGRNEWTEMKYNRSRSFIDTIVCGVHWKLGKFSFFDSRDNILSFCVSDVQNNVAITDWKKTRSIIANPNHEPEVCYYPCHSRFKEIMKKKPGYLGNQNENVSFSICGTRFVTKSDDTDKYIFNEILNISDHVEESKSPRKYKGVWIYPRFYQASPKEQSW